jgi:3-phosphoshikimate 1-carboxyvinyltransferase
MPIERTGNGVRIHPAGAVTGIVQPPGSKSLTNRYLACTALADGRSILRGASLSDDTQAMVAGLGQLGMATEVRAAHREVVVTGCRGNVDADDVEIDAGNAGTAMRFLTALACLGYGRRRLDGSPRMRQRPIGALVDALTELGAQIGYEAAEGFPPVTIVARGLTGGEVVFRTPPSSQFLSAVLMVSPYATRDVMIRVDGTLPSRPYVDMTIDVMRSLGVELLESGGRFVVPAFQRYQAGEHGIEPDASAATYFWAAVAVTGGRIRVAGLTRRSRQGDVRFVDVLAQMGCRVHEDGSSLEVEAPAAGRLRGVAVDLNEMPDTVQTLAVAALFADGPTEIRNVANLRIKETDRIAALATELTRLGAKVETRPDGLTIHPPQQITPAAIETYDDHRMAMSFAIAGLVVDGIVIKDARCVAKSFPDFFDVLGRL